MIKTDAGNNDYGGQYAKNVYLGETRIVTKLYLKNVPRVNAEEVQQYIYHSDHLGSASLISDYKGDEYQRIEYTPYGETWIERTDNKGVDYLPYRFTCKELDEETGLYYYGARYLDPKYSMWISTDPALGEYIPKAPIDDDAKKYNQNLPGMGGVFNHINGNLYAYAANNPVKYTDPDGRISNDEILKRNTLFSEIVDMANNCGWWYQYNLDYQGNSILIGGANLGKNEINKLKKISMLACTAGAISLRNEYRDDKLQINEWAVDLRNGSDISYYKDDNGANIIDPQKLFEKLEVGDLLIYSNPKNPKGIKGKGWTGHTASIIGKGKNYLITLEFHEDGKDPTINKIYSDSLQWFGDTKLEGGASWN